MRRRRRLARLLDRALNARNAVRREWAWFCRDLRDWRSEWTTYVTLQPKGRRRGK